MPVERNLGKRCRHAETCPLFHGVEIPEHMTLPVWRNVFCYRGSKGWVNCSRYHVIQEKNSLKRTPNE